MKKEAVNHPGHYKSGNMEAIDVIESFGLGFNLGNVIKYVLRAGHKDDIVQDLKKAEWYLRREIDRIETCRANTEAGTRESTEHKIEATPDGPMTGSRIKTTVSERKPETGGDPLVKSRIAAILTGEL